MRQMIFSVACLLVLAGCENTQSSKEAAPAAAEPAKPPAVAPTAAVAAPAPEAPKGPAAPKVAMSPVIDTVTPGDQVGEEAHGLKGKDDETGDWSDRTYRHSQGGWFSWDLKVLPDEATELRVTYWGNDQRSFDILVDGQKLVTERINNNKPDEFFEKAYTLTPEMTKGKSKVTIEFKALTQGYAGGVFGVRTARPGMAK